MCLSMTADSTHAKVLIIDDEPQIRRLLRLTLEDVGYKIFEAENGLQGLASAATNAPDVVILDLGLPDMNGVDVLRQLRKTSSVPVLILSVFGQEGSKIAALDAGADDYLTKPFGDGELLARLRALLRRVRPAIASNLFRFGDVEVDFEKRRVTKAGKWVKLTATEYALLSLFIAHRDKAISHRYLLTELWGPKAESQTHYLRTYMMRLRRKLEDELDSPKHFQTESGVGYRFISEPE
jgi:two-component system KDP operon response regulator KdpE